MPSPRDLLPTPVDPTPEARGLLRATVLGTSPLRVSVPSLAGRVIEIQHPGSLSPSVDDLVLIAFDEEGDEWLIGVS